MSRRFVAGFLVAALPVAALLGLVLHAHPDDHDTDHHAARAVHAHFGGHGHGHHDARADGRPIFDDAGDHDRAVYFESFVGEATASFVIAAAIPVEIDIPTPQVQAAQPPVQVVHGHDPPLRSRSAPRAPPAFLS